MRKLFLCAASCVLLAIQSSLGLCSKDLSSPLDNLADNVWTMIGPGDADQVTSLSVTRDGSVFLGSDIGGIYLTTNQGDNWSALNVALNNYDVTTAVLPAPNDSNTLFVGTRGGFYKSQDGGQTWRNPRKGLPSLSTHKLSGSIGAIATDPYNPDNLYLGLGYRQSSDGTTTVKKLKWSRYIYTSSDQGESWRPILAFPTPSKVTQLLVSANHKNTIYAATSSGVYRGNTQTNLWQAILKQPCLGIMEFSENPERLLAACGTAGILESTSLGRHWEPQNAGLLFKAHSSGPDRYSIIARAKPGTDLFAINSTWGSGGGVYRSTDDARTWQRVTNRLPESWLRRSSRINAIAFDQNDSDLIYIGSSRYVYRSRDNGNSWEQLISRNTGSGWTHTGLNIFGHTRDIEVNPTNPDQIFIATADHGIAVSNDRGYSWNKIGEEPRYGQSSADLQFVQRTGEENASLYSASFTWGNKSCLSVTTNSGNTWRALCDTLDPNNRVMKILTNPATPDRIVLGTHKGIFTSNNAGNTWSNGTSALRNEKVTALAAHPSRPDTLFAGAKSGLYKSTDGGKRWLPIPFLSNVPITSVAVLRGQPETFLVGSETSRSGPAALYRSINSGKSWYPVIKKLHKYVSGIVQLPSDDSTVYIAINDHNYHDRSSGSGMFVSTDRGRTWSEQNLGLPVRRAWNISVADAYPDLVFLSSNGSGAYVLKHPPNANSGATTK
ncbi:MAG TPA: hypothetical protein EYN01_00905 [Chromatiales bacterium]|nr:hypothetical protein [Chromatiales bacterium]